MVTWRDHYLEFIVRLISRTRADREVARLRSSVIAGFTIGGSHTRTRFLLRAASNYGGGLHQ